MTILHLSVVLSLMVFVIAIAARAIRIAKMPIHLRWELYPVPHEKGRAKHGGSMMEEVNFWSKPREIDHIGELFVMIPEILFLKGVWEHNRQLWFASWTLHFGLYLLIGDMFLLIIKAIIAANGISLAAGMPALLLELIKYIALAGFVIGTIGSISMMYKRTFNTRMRMYSNASHYFNILHLGVIYISGLLWFNLDSMFIQNLSQLYVSLLSFAPVSKLPLIAYIHIASVLLFFVYLPFTHMTHFFTKYFTYHEVRWEDKPNRPGSKVEKGIKKAVVQPVSWSAPHVKADGKKTWVDLLKYTGGETEEEKE